MKRLELLSSPVFLLALAVLVVNDWALKPLFHDALTGKLSDFAGLAAFTLFLCSLWRERRIAIAVGISVTFTLWKSPYAQGLIDAANHWLPFTVGRTVDYTDLIALPVVWLCAAYAPRLPLLPLRSLQVWFLAMFSVAAFTATSAPPTREITWQMAQIGPAGQDASVAGTEADLQRMLDVLAKSHGMHCTTCQPLAMGRVYESEEASDGPTLLLYAYYDKGRPMLVYEVSWSIRYGEKQGAALRTDLMEELHGRFPLVEIQPAAPPSVVASADIDVARVEGYTPQADKANDAIYQDMLSVVTSIMAEAGLEKAAEGSFSGGPVLDMHGRREMEVYVSPYALSVMVRCYTIYCKARVAPLADKLERALKQKFGAGKVKQEREPPA